MRVKELQTKIGLSVKAYEEIKKNNSWTASSVISNNLIVYKGPYNYWNVEQYKTKEELVKSVKRMYENPKEHDWSFDTSIFCLVINGQNKKVGIKATLVLSN